MLFRPPVTHARLCVQRRVSMATTAQNYMPNFVPIEEISSNSRVGLIRLVSYNILAQAYVKSIFFPHSPSCCLRWKARSQATLSHLLSFKADILCLQEVDEYETFYKEQLAAHGFSSVYVKRSGKKKDGCGIFYRHERVKLIANEPIIYNDLVPCTEDDDEASTGTSDEEFSEGRDTNDPRVRLKRDCVGLLAAFHIHGATERAFVLANTHLYWDPEWVDVKLAQAKYLATRLSEFHVKMETHLSSKIPILVCGDFNSTPGDQVYNYLISGAMANIGAVLETEPLWQCPLPLYSLYSVIKGEPAFTNCTPDFTGTLDYIFISSLDQAKPLSILEISCKGSPDLEGGLPNLFHPSDHLPIGTDIAIMGG